MTPVIITKNVEIGNERWKPSATIIEENVNNLQHVDVTPQPSFISTDAGMFYIVPEFPNNGFTQPPTTLIVQQEPTLVNGLTNGMTNGMVNGDATTQGHPGIPLQMTGPEMVNHAIQNDAIPKDLPPEELKRMIQLQFEYYFSRENLANDQYLGET